MGKLNRLPIIFLILIIMTILGCSSTVILKEEPPLYKLPPKEPGPPPWAPAHGYRAKYRYYYYPESYVYFDIERRIYFYFAGSGWRASVSLPSGININLNNYVVLEMDVSEPYHFHSEVVKRYPPGLFKKSQENGKKKGRDKGRD